MTYFLETKQSEILTAVGGCFVCKKTEDNHILYGEIFTKSNISVHLYCLFFSKNLLQLGKETSGIQRFLINDIKTLMLNESKNICCYCNQPSATIYCWHEDDKNPCSRRFHFQCGIKHNAQFECLDFYKVYCYEHINIIDKNIPLSTTTNEDDCIICFKPIGEYNPVQHIPSCCSLCWMHVNCVRHYAYHSGYGFRCIACRNNSEEYKILIKKRGIFIPTRDSTWEKDRNAFQYLLKRHSLCNAITCLCSRGREYNQGIWHIMLCEVCAAFGTHNRCRENVINENEFKCNNCLDILNKKQNSYIQTVSNTLFDNNSFGMTMPDNIFATQSQHQGSNLLATTSSSNVENSLEIQRTLSILKMIKMVYDSSEKK